jgi:hypothetical protein
MMVDVLFDDTERAVKDTGPTTDAPVLIGGNNASFRVPLQGTSETRINT